MNAAVLRLPLAGNTRPTEWPGRSDGLSPRESDVILLISYGLSNQDVAGRLFLSINTIKSLIRSAYRVMDVDSRAEAVLWAVEHGFRDDLVRRRADALPTPAVGNAG